LRKAAGDVRQHARFWLENKTFPPDEITVRLYHRVTQIYGFPNGNVGHAWMMADPLVEKLGAKAVTSREGAGSLRQTHL